MKARWINMRSSRLGFISMQMVKPRLPIWRVAMAGLILLLLAALAADYFYSLNKISELRGAASIEGGVSVQSEPIDPEEFANVERGIHQLAIPWGTLFTALENVHTDKVILLSLDPDSEKQSVRILAETSDVYEMLGYIRALAAQPKVEHVVLVSQKAGENTQVPTVRFTLEAYWGRI